MLMAALPPEDLPLETRLVPVAVEEEPLPVRPADRCKGLSHEDLGVYFLNPGCKIQGRRGQRKINTRVATAIIGHIEVQSATNLPAPLSALTIAMQEVAAKVADVEKHVSGAGQKTQSAKKHKAKDQAPVEIAHAPARPGGMPNMINAYTAETKLSRQHGPFNDSSPHTKLR
jgi:hypothetical protein